MQDNSDIIKVNEIIINDKKDGNPILEHFEEYTKEDYADDPHHMKKVALYHFYRGIVFAKNYFGDKSDRAQELKEAAAKLKKYVESETKKMEHVDELSEAVKLGLQILAEHNSSKQGIIGT